MRTRECNQKLWTYLYFIVCKLPVVPRRKLFKSFMTNPIFYILVLHMYIITFMFLLPRCCNDWVFSKYYSWPKDVIIKRVTDLNNRRVLDAQRYLYAVGTDDSLDYHKKLSKQENVDIVIAVVTVKRKANTTLKYLTQVLANYDLLFKKDNLYFPRKVLFICDTYAGPGPHTEALSLAKYFLLVQRFPDGSDNALTMDKFKKETSDYVYCLEKALQYKPKYILINEDDAIPRLEFFSTLKYILNNLIENTFNKGGHMKNSKWAYLKLYYPEKWQGYGNDPRLVLEIVGIGCVGGTVTVILSFLCRRRVTSLRAYKYMWYFDAAVGAVFFILVAELLGRQHLLEWRRLSKYLYAVVTAPACCSPAVLYKADIVHEVAAYLNVTETSSSLPIDLALHDFVVKKGYMRYIVEPNLVKHIGFFSSLKGETKNPKQFLF